MLAFLCAAQLDVVQDACSESFARPQQRHMVLESTVSCWLSLVGGKFSLFIYCKP